MAQAPAVPKLIRARHLFEAEVLGRVSPGAGMIPSEHAALALRAAALDHRPAQQVAFLLPLVGKASVKDWDAVVARLQTTLNSFLKQDNPNWIALVCCQDKPLLPEDPRIRFLSFEDPIPGNDKWRKLRALSEAIPDHVSTPGYVMSFDADDVLRQGTVAEMLTREESGGYLVQAGLVMDVRENDIALADRSSLVAPLRKPFWKLCGSCAALYHDPDVPQSTAFIAEMTQHEHRMFPYLARLAGQRLAPLSQPAVLYILNHGENFGARRGRVGFKTRFVQRFKITDPARLVDISRDFFLEDPV